MVRTIISLSTDLKRWLDRYSREHHQSTAETIRAAIKQFQQNASHKTHRDSLMKTAGILDNKVDGVKYVRKLRKEWDE